MTKIIILKYEEKCYACSHYMNAGICQITGLHMYDNDDCDCDNFLQDLDIVDDEQIDNQADWPEEFKEK